MRVMDSRENQGRWGISWVGRNEPFPDAAALQSLTPGWVRLPADLTAIETARAAGCGVLVVLKGTVETLPALEATVKALKSHVRHWEIDSEPDDPAFGWPADDLTSYARYLQAAATLIKTVDPTAVVHNGGLGRSLPKGIARLHALGVGTAVDVWNVHPYLNPLMPDATGGLRYFHDMIQKTLTTLGDGAKPVWWTSIACPGMADPKAAANWWLGKNPTESVQADWARLVMTQVPTWGVAKVFWEGWRDQPGRTGTGIDAFGLHRTDGSPKPACDVLTAALPT